jgi:hypothetical protein
MGEMMGRYPPGVGFYLSCFGLFFIRCSRCTRRSRETIYGRVEHIITPYNTRGILFTTASLFYDTFLPGVLKTISDVIGWTLRLGMFFFSYLFFILGTVP